MGKSHTSSPYAWKQGMTSKILRRPSNVTACSTVTLWSKNESEQNYFPKSSLMFFRPLSTHFTCDIPTRMFLCVSSTPFGRPVVPDEHSTNATLFCISIGLHLSSLHSSSWKCHGINWIVNWLIRCSSKVSKKNSISELHHTHLNRTNQFRIRCSEFCWEFFVHLFASIYLHKYDLLNKWISTRDFKCTRCNCHWSENQFWSR